MEAPTSGMLNGLGPLGLKWKTWRIVIVVVLAVGGVTGYVAYRVGFQGTPQCSNANALVGCGPYPTLEILDAEAQVGSYPPTHCQRTALTAVCSAPVAGGDSGKVMLNVTFKGVQPGTYIGGVSVAFLVYSSSSQYVNFTSMPTCAFTSGPNFDTRGCQVPSNGQAEFQFSFSVSPNYNPSNQHWPDSVTVSMWQTCCFP